jgi:hypothetical protein
VNASAPFTNDRYDEEPYAEAEGTELGRVHIKRTFTGDLDGASTAELMIARSEAVAAISAMTGSPGRSAAGPAASSSSTPG